MSAGAANRMTCQSGKFHGMTASTTPSGWYRVYACARADRVGRARLVGEERLGVLGEEPARLRALLRFGTRRHERLAHLGRHDARDLVGLGVEDVGGGAHPARRAGRSVVRR